MEDVIMNFRAGRILSSIALYFLVDLRWLFCVILSVMITAGCASLPPAQIARDLKMIDGKWEGSVYLGGAGSKGSFPATMTITQDGRFDMLVPGLSMSPGPRFVGTIAVIDEKFRFKSETTGSTGTYTLHEGDGKRILVGVADGGSSSNEFRPAK